MMGAMRVTLLGFTQPQFDNQEIALHHGSATFLFEGISRACTHQLVRHRLASFSQESQRYVDLQKGGWQAIVPDAVAANAEAMAELAEFWQIAEGEVCQIATVRYTQRGCPLPTAQRCGDTYCHYHELRRMESFLLAARR